MITLEDGTEGSMVIGLIKHYELLDKSTGVVKRYKTRNAATKAADRRDNEYGCYICRVTAVYA
jgi:hypothetical protein